MKLAAKDPFLLQQHPGTFFSVFKTHKMRYGMVATGVIPENIKVPIFPPISTYMFSFRVVESPIVKDKWLRKYPLFCII